MIVVDEALGQNDGRNVILEGLGDKKSLHSFDRNDHPFHLPQACNRPKKKVFVGKI